MLVIAHGSNQVTRGWLPARRPLRLQLRALAPVLAKASTDGARMVGEAQRQLRQRATFASSLASSLSCCGAAQGVTVSPRRRPSATSPHCPALHASPRPATPPSQDPTWSLGVGPLETGRRLARQVGVRAAYLSPQPLGTPQRASASRNTLGSPGINTGRRRRSASTTRMDSFSEALRPAVAAAQVRGNRNLIQLVMLIIHRIMFLKQCDILFSSKYLYLVECPVCLVLQLFFVLPVHAGRWAHLARTAVLLGLTLAMTLIFGVHMIRGGISLSGSCECRLLSSAMSVRRAPDIHEPILTLSLLRVLRQRHHGCVPAVAAGLSVGEAGGQVEQRRVHPHRGDRGLRGGRLQAQDHHPRHADRRAR